MSVNIKLKHSSVEDKAPLPADASEGEILLNIHENSPAAYIKDSGGNIVKLAGENSVSTDTDVVKKSETASQNMVGDLTLGTGMANGEKITLDSSDGTGTFTEKITIDNTGNDATLWLKNGSSATSGADSQINFGNTEGDGSIGYSDASNNFMNFKVADKEIVRMKSYDPTSIFGDLRMGVAMTEMDAQFCVFESAHFAYENPLGNYTPHIKLEKVLTDDGGGAFTTTGKITTDDLETTGSATFAGGNVQLYDPGASDAGAILFSTSSGGTLRSKFQGTTAETGVYSYANSPITFHVGSSAEKVALTIASDLSAEFEGSINASGSASIDGNVFAGYNTYPTTGVKLGSDGSINATGNILVGDNAASASSTGGYIYSTRYINAANVGSAALNGQAADGDLASLAIIDRSSGSAVETVVIKPTGSATFASNVDVGTPNSTTDGGSRVSYVGQFVANAADATYKTFISKTLNQEKIVFYGSGAATFAGDMDITVVEDAPNKNVLKVVGSTTDGSQGGTFVYKNDGACYWRDKDNSDNVIFAANGSAEFSGIATAKGATLKPTDITGGLYVMDSSDSTKSAATITGDGSASFAGGGNFNGANLTNTALGVFTNSTTTNGLTVKNTTSVNHSLIRGFNNADVQTAVIDSEGSATFNGTVTATVVPPSDARFKENITPAKPQLADVVALGGILKNYDWNDQAPLNEEIRSQRQLGLIAQEAAEVCPAIVKDIHRTKQGAVITPEEIIPAVYEEKVIPAEYETVVTPAKLGPKGKEIVPASSEEVLVTPERTEQVLVTPEKVIPATYEELDDSYKGISTDALIMKLIGAVAELSAEVTALKATKKTRTTK